MKSIKEDLNKEDLLDNLNAIEYRSNSEELWRRYISNILDLDALTFPQLKGFILRGNYEINKE
jgi:hypothetical protein